MTGSAGAFHTADIRAVWPLKNSTGLSKTSSRSNDRPAVGSSGSTPLGTALESTNDSRPWAYMLNYNRYVYNSIYMIVDRYRCILV